MTADLLIVGNIAKDITDDGWRPGGSVYYAAAQARRLGLSVAAVTACAPDIDPRGLLRDVEWHVVASPSTTTFENRYDGGRRRQRVLAQARQLSAADLPARWQRARLVLLAPVLQDLSADLVAVLVARETDAFVGALAQGWLRRVEGGDVLPGLWPTTPPWQGCDAVFLSDEDVLDITDERTASDTAPLVVLTRGEAGCSVWQDGRRQDLPALPARLVDPTGAGDVFAAAFLVEYARAGDAVAAARFAAAAAALAVEGEGASNLGDRAAIEARLAGEAALRR